MNPSMSTIGKIYTDFKKFLSQIVRDPFSWMWTHCKMVRPPYFFTSIYLLGLTNIYLRISTKEYPVSSGLLLLLILVCAIISGFIDYWIRGAFYHLRVMICGGKGSMRTSMHLYLYSGWPLYIANTIILVLVTSVYGPDILRISFKYPLRELLLSFEMLVMVYTYSVSYQLVSLVQEAKKIPSLIFFLFLPFCTTILWHYSVLLKLAH